MPNFEEIVVHKIIHFVIRFLIQLEQIPFLKFLKLAL